MLRHNKNGLFDLMQPEPVVANSKKNALVMRCNECSSVFCVEPDDIKSAEVEVQGQSIWLQYFTCPECKRLYRISTMDKKLKELIGKYESEKARWQQSVGRNDNSRVVSKQNAVVRRALDEARAYQRVLENKYAGTFTFDVVGRSKDDEGRIVYLP